MSGTDIFREEDCPAHKHIEWDVSYDALLESKGPLESPVFKINKNSYKLQSGIGYNQKYVFVTFLLKGPQDTEQPSTDLYWLGMKCSDGTYNYITWSEKLLFIEKRESWTKNFKCFKINLSYLEKFYLTSDGCLSFFFRMNVDRVPAYVEACIHGTPPMEEPHSGIIREVVCPTHKEVEWDVGHEPQTKDCTLVVSPVFEIGSQVCFFELDPNWWGAIKLDIYRRGRPVAAKFRYWYGMKRVDGSYPEDIRSEVLDFGNDLGLWTRLEHPVIYGQETVDEEYLTAHRRLRIYFRINLESTRAETCIHGIPPVPFEVQGTVQYEKCSTHTQVEWGITKTEELNGKRSRMRSPTFEIGSQHFFFQLTFPYSSQYIFVSIFRTGCPMPGTVRWWVGIRLNDGSYLDKICSDKLDLREDFGFWTDAGMDFYLHDLKEMDLELDESQTIFLRMTGEPTGQGMCTHGIPRFSGRTSGIIREKRCPNHTHLEWDVRKCMETGIKLMASPVFQIGSQQYFLYLLLLGKQRHRFTLFRMGPSVPRTFRWWAGRRLTDGSYPSFCCNGKLDLQEDLGLWTKVADLVHKDSLGEFDWDSSDSELSGSELTGSDFSGSFFFRLNVEPTREGSCTHVPVILHSERVQGIIRKEDCSFHRQVVWNVALKPINGVDFSTTPVFEVENQRYYLHLCEESYVFQLMLYRLGISAPSVRCWAGFKRDDGTYHHEIQVAELDLGQECSLWAEVACFRLSNRSNLERKHAMSDGRLQIFVRMDGSRSASGEGVCNHGTTQLCAPGEGIIRQKNSHSVEWAVTYEATRDHTHLSISPAFRIGDQCYMGELQYEVDGVLAISLYRSGRALSVRCWSAIECISGSHYYFAEGVNLAMEEDRELWERAAVLGHFRRSDLETRHVTSDGRLSFLFRLEPSGTEKVVQDIATL